MNENRKSSGFTLIEMLAALAIAALILSLALPTFGTAFTPAKLDAAALRLATLFENERYAARLSGQPSVIEINKVNRELIARRTKTALTLPSALSLGFDVIAPCPDGESIVTFYPDGRSCSPLIHLKSRSASVDIEISAATGAISIVQ